MKNLVFIMISLLTACHTPTHKSGPADTVSIHHSEPVAAPEEPQAGPMPVAEPPKVYSNTRFRDVTVKEVLEGRYTVKGQAQVFEASFGWVIEDGHKELKNGYAMTDAGAPEWGNFKFTVDKPNNNSSLHLILFELSPKDGARKYELPIPLN